MAANPLKDITIVKKVAESLGVKVNDEACKLIYLEMESTLRIVVQNALKYTKHANRDTLKIQDINHAIKDLNILDSMYGPEDNDPRSYNTELDMAFKSTRVIGLDEALRQEILGLKAEPTPAVSMNWMVVNGFIPKIPENANILSLKEQEFSRNTIDMNDMKENTLKMVLTKELTENFLSRELQLFLNDVFEVIKNEETAIDMATPGKGYKMSGSFKKILVTLRNSPGLNNLIPVLINFLYQQHESVPSNGIIKKTNLARIIMSHVYNLHFNLEFHLHILIKILLSFITSTNLTSDYTNSDIPPELYLREMSAKALATLILRYEDKYFNMKYNIATTLIGIFEKDPTNYHTLYGILKFFFYLDPNIVKDFLLKKLAKRLKISQFFRDMYQIIESSNEDAGSIGAYNVKGIVARHVYSVLLELCNKVMSNLSMYSSKSVYESANLYNFVTDIFGEASLIAPSYRDSLIMEEQAKSRAAPLGYLNICL